MPTVRQLDNSIRNSRRQLDPEYKDWILYSAVQCGTASAARALNFFQDSIASVGKAYTNMETPAQLNSGKTFLVTEIEAYLYNNDGAAIRSDNAIAFTPNLIFGTMHGDFKVNSVIQLELQGIMLHEPFERVDAASTVGAGPVNTKQYKKLKLRTPIQLDPQTNFILSANFTSPAATGGYSATTTYMMVMLRGLMRRMK